MSAGERLALLPEARPERRDRRADAPDRTPMPALADRPFVGALTCRCPLCGWPNLIEAAAGWPAEGSERVGSVVIEWRVRRVEEGPGAPD